MKRILVTGSSGQLGLTLQELAPNYPELAFDFKTRKKLDVTKKKEIEKVLADTPYDFCINCAAYTDVEKAEKDPEEAFEVNEKGSKNLAESCFENNIILIHISTDYVFDGEKGSAYLPEDVPNPINQYGQSKLEGEEHIKRILKKFYIVRTSWLYSKKHGKNFYKTIVEKIENGGPLKVTDGQIGCPTNTESLSRFLIESIIKDQKPFGTYHFTDEEAMTWLEFAKKIILERNSVNKVELVADKNYRTFARRPKNSVLSPHNN